MTAPTQPHNYQLFRVVLVVRLNSLASISTAAARLWAHENAVPNSVSNTNIGTPLLGISNQHTALMVLPLSERSQALAVERPFSDLAQFLLTARPLSLRLQARFAAVKSLMTTLSAGSLVQLSCKADRIKHPTDHTTSRRVATIVRSCARSSRSRRTRVVASTGDRTM